MLLRKDMEIGWNLARSIWSPKAIQRQLWHGSKCEQTYMIAYVVVRTAWFNLEQRILAPSKFSLPVDITHSCGKWGPMHSCMRSASMRACYGLIVRGNELLGFRNMLQYLFVATYNFAIHCSAHAVPSRYFKTHRSAWCWLFPPLPCSSNCLPNS